jgi:hypothetical protein
MLIDGFHEIRGRTFFLTGSSPEYIYAATERLAGGHRRIPDKSPRSDYVQMIKLTDISRSFKYLLLTEVRCGFSLMTPSKRIFGLPIENVVAS